MSSSGLTSLANVPQLNTKVLRKAVALSGLIVGANALVTAAGGVSRIDALTLRVTVAATSAGAPTLAVKSHGTTLTTAPIALASLTLGALISRALGNTTIAAVAAGLTVEPSPAVAVAEQGGLVVSSDFASAALEATVAVAVYTGGTLEVDVVYTPMTLGATLT